MTTLAANLPRPYELGTINAFPVIAADIIYEGAAVGDDGNGYARPLQAGDAFLGFAESKADNSAGSAGDISVRVRAAGLVQLPISALAITDRGKDVFASDDNAFTLTQSTNTRIGYVHRWVSTGVGIIAFEANHGIITELVDNTGGSANGTLADGLTLAALTENSGAIGGTNNGDLPDLTATAVVLDNTVSASADAQQDVDACVVTDGNMGGSADGAFETVGSTSGGDVSGAIMNNFKEVQAALVVAQKNDATLAVAVNQIIADNIALRAAIREVAAAVNTARTDLSTQNDNDAELTARVNSIIRQLGN